MKFESSKALDFEYLLLEFYKTLNIQEREVVIILMIEHLLKQGNDFITSDLLALKMKYDIKEIDASLSILFTKGYLEYKEVNNELHTSLDSLKKSLFKTFEKTIFTEEEISKNEIIEEKRKIIFDAFMSSFNRNLSPIEISRIDSWIEQDVDQTIILDALKDASNREKLSVMYIDRLIVNKLKEEDRDGNRLKK
ncbi:MAG: DnaD domain protein [Candidatus Onthovivens sp.]|nr:DnaD domain protein [Mollicutes bacterium]MDY4937336.1 DnaD domain protein [Candidatus Onthovivens sp.]